MDRAVVVVGAWPAEAMTFAPELLLERACELIVDAGRAGAGWIIFPEAYLPGAPAWLWHGPEDDAGARELHALARASAIVIPGDVSDRLCRVAQRGRVGVAIGLVERDNVACYNSLLIIDVHGRICGHYRATPGTTSQGCRWSLVAGTTTTQSGQTAQQDWAGGI